MPSIDELIDSASPQPSADLLQRITAQIAECISLQQRLSDLGDEMHRANAALLNLLRVELPDLFDQAGTNRMDIPPEGNSPGISAKLQPYFRANIAADWSEEKRRAAFDWLEQNGHGDLIKTTVTFEFPREAHDQVDHFIRANAAWHPQAKANVHMQTLTKWLKEQVSSNGALPPLELIGADIGRVVKLTKQED